MYKGDTWRRQGTKPGAKEPAQPRGVARFWRQLRPWSDPWWGPCPCPPCPKSAKQNSSKDPCLLSSLSVVSINPCPWGKIVPLTLTHYILAPSPLHLHPGRTGPGRTGPGHSHTLGSGSLELGIFARQGPARASQGRRRGGRPPTPERQENPGRSRDFLDPVDRLWVPCVHAQSPSSCAIQPQSSPILSPSHHSPSQPIQRMPHSQVGRYLSAHLTL